MHLTQHVLSLLIASGPLLGLLPFASAATSSSPAPSVTSTSNKPLPTVHMLRVVLAAFLDPRKSSREPTEGAEQSVRLVKQALGAINLSSTDMHDGHYGISALNAYRKYQESLGFRGLDANGIPGLASLAKLGEGRFRIVEPTGTGVKMKLDGHVVTKRTAAMYSVARRRLAANPDPNIAAGASNLTIVSGSYVASGAGNTSSGTNATGLPERIVHEGGGVIDVAAADLTPLQREALVKAMREVGFAAFLRTPDEGRWDWHVHAVAIADVDAVAPARDQVYEYYRGNNYIGSSIKKDNGPGIKPVVWERLGLPLPTLAEIGKLMLQTSQKS